MSKLQKKAVEAFLYSPIDLDLKLKCFCGEKLKLTGYGNSFGHGNGEAECKNGHYMILAHKFVSKQDLPRYSDKFDVIFNLTRFEDEICTYCKKRIGKNTEWQREIIDNSRAVHKRCHENKVFEVIQKAREYTQDWHEISRILERENLEFGMMSYSGYMYKKLLEERINELELEQLQQAR